MIKISHEQHHTIAPMNSEVQPSAIAQAPQIDPQTGTVHYDVAPESDQGGNLYFTAPMYAVGSEQWTKLDHDQKDDQYTRRTGHLKGLLNLTQMQLKEVSTERDEHRDEALRYAEEALTDQLTGLGNRRKLAEVLEQRIKDDIDTALVFIDLDRFKQVNDEFGHEKGDSLLRAIADKLQKKLTLRDGEFIVRLGGDEFVIVINPNQKENDRRHTFTPEQVVAGVQKRTKSLTELAAKEQGVSFVSASTGGVIREPGESSEALLDRADKKMFEDKISRKAQR